MSPKSYSILLLPKSLTRERLELLAIKLREFKLHALATDAKAFSLEYATEAELPLSTWFSRIVNISTQILVCVATDQTVTTSEQVDAEAQWRIFMESEWAGIFTMVFTATREAWIYPESGQPIPGPDEEETRWQLTSLFIPPAHRGKGLAKSITFAAIHFGVVQDGISTGRSTGVLNADSIPLHKQAMQPETGSVKQEEKKKTTRFRLIVHPNNKDVVGMYLKLEIGRAHV